MFFISSLSLSQNRGPRQEEATAPTNSNVRRPHPPPTRTRGPSRFSLRYPRYPRQPSPWSSPCPPRRRCLSMQRRRLPPSLSASLRLCGVSAPNATMLPQLQLPPLPVLEVESLTLYQLRKRSGFKMSSRGKQPGGASPSVEPAAAAAGQIHTRRYSITLKRNGWTEKLSLLGFVGQLSV